MEVPDLIWKIGSDMDILDPIWKFWFLYGNSGSEMEISDLKWKFHI
jgi:hypothetical protein